MQTRRELLLSGLALPLCTAKYREEKSRDDRMSIVAEDHCLAEESARGYQELIESHPSGGPITIVPALRTLSRRSASMLLEQARGGRWIVLEDASFLADSAERVSHCSTLNHFFGVNVTDPATLPSNAWAGEYVRFHWPLVRNTRTFLSVTPLQTKSGEIIAAWKGLPVAVRRPIGEGGVIVLGSLLGPGLVAGDREAHDIGSALLSRLRSAI